MMLNQMLTFKKGTKWGLYLGVVVGLSCAVFYQSKKIEEFVKEDYLGIASAYIIQHMPEDKKPAIKKISNTDFVCLSKNIYHEAGNQDFMGKIAVGAVTLNRATDGRWPKSVCNVVNQSYTNEETGTKTCQFSWRCLENIIAPSANNPNWVASQKAAQLLLEGGYDQYYKGMFQNVTYFHAKYVKPDWASKKKLVVQIGDHIFYK